jgi:tetratricopeptide (TPR) repeat protein
MTVRTGIMARAYFIYGAPGESEQTIDDTLSLMARIRPLAAIFYILDLFPGTELYAAYKAKNNVTDDIWLDRIEDLLYVDTDAALSRERVLAFGRRLREGYFSRLPEYAGSIELADDPELFPLHADFLSRLALTFSHGDYATNPLIPDALQTAVALFERALEYHPDHRAFWGLGLVYQHQGRVAESIAILENGLRHHAASHEMAVALANSLIRQNRIAEARERLTPFADHGQAMELIVRCCRLMGDRKGERSWRQRLIDLRQPRTEPILR